MGVMHCRRKHKAAVEPEIENIVKNRNSAEKEVAAL